jgi:hypothetical protein
MPDDTEAAALRAQLEAIVKGAEDAEAQAVAAHRCVQAACLLLEEESKTTALEQTTTTALQRVPSSSSSSSSPAAALKLVPTASSSYEETVVVGFHLQTAATLNVRQLVNIVLDPSSPSVVMPSNIVALPTADAEVLKQRLDALVVTVEVAEEKAATVRRRILAARQLLDEEQAAIADLERQATAKKLVLGSTTFSITEIATASSSYVDTIVANLHIQADTMMEQIHLDTSGLVATPTAFYSKKRCPLHCRHLWHRLTRLARTTAAASATVTTVTTTGIRTTTAATCYLTKPTHSSHVLCAVHMVTRSTNRSLGPLADTATIQNST